VNGAADETAAREMAAPGTGGSGGTGPAGTDTAGEAALSWLGGREPAAPAGVTWGVPWPRGALFPGTGVSLLAGDGRSVPVQTWPLAAWPDGSLKWTGHAAVLGPGEGRLRLAAGDRGRSGDGTGGDGTGELRVTEDAAAITVDTGPLRCVVARQGPALISLLAVDGQARCSGVRPVAVLERRRALPRGEERTRTRAPGLIDAAVVEHRGGQRCVIRAEGAHLVQEASGTSRRLPYVIRLYFYRGLTRVRIVHTLVIDHDVAEDLVAGAGVEASVPLAGPAWNRHVLLGGDDGGFFAEPAQLLWTWRHKDAGGRYQRQIAGEPVDLSGPDQAAVRELLRDQAVWRSVRLVQDSAGHYEIAKRTREGCAWVSAGHGRRAAGVAAVAAEAGGLAAAVSDFWRKAPRSLEIDGLGGDTAVLRCWLWSPDCEPMDLRHYDTEAHMQAAYEGFDEVRGDARGVANTNELWLEPVAAGQQRAAATALAAVADAAPLLVCEPARYHGTGALGVWSLRAGPGAGPARQWAERQLDAALDFYLAEVDQRDWYGFWDYGDVMHSYDPVRHSWRYDTGGFAWQNTELVPNLWLWYSFLRTGRADVFRMAAAMARHTSEVDVFHRGQYAGLGSRHNVRHWGCSCKEARISMAGLHRPFLYLTADERAGEVMREVAASVEEAVERLDPARTLVPRGADRAHLRSGPDWAALCSNWMTEWERSGDPASLAAIRAGIESLAQAPMRLLSGPVFGYDRATRRLRHIGDDNYSYHMIMPFGGPETWMELCGLLPGDGAAGDGVAAPGLAEMLREFGRFAALGEEERDAASGGRISPANWNASGFFPARLVAFAAAADGDDRLAARAWEMLLRPGRQLAFPVEPVPVPPGQSHRPLRELPWVSTNSVSQWSLNVIECLALVPGALEEAWRRAGWAATDVREEPGPGAGVREPGR
jgi:hypothetical protein